MLSIIYKPYADISCITIRPDSDIKGIVFAYHGWTSCKDALVELGVEIAKQGLLVIMPDAFQHGERQISEIKTEDFPKVLWHTSQEFEGILSEVQAIYGNQLPIGMTGISMGGVLTAMLFTQYKCIHKAAILMGTPNLTGFFKELTLQYTKSNVEDSFKALNIPLMIFDMDLAKHIKDIDYRQLYFWHAKNDGVVPFKFTQAFVEEATAKGYGSQIIFEVSEQEGHHVPHPVKRQAAKFLAASLNNS